MFFILQNKKKKQFVNRVYILVYVTSTVFQHTASVNIYFCKNLGHMPGHQTLTNELIMIFFSLSTLTNSLLSDSLLVNTVLLA